jgi:maltose alpha-D-glucosyltransferase/alpha-amylase
MPGWLEGAVFYEIYPQSFCDASGDGIGDIEGIVRKLDCVRDLGRNALRINPCFDSPFKDAGYEVRDYKKIAPRYGSNEDMYRLFQAAHQKGIRVLLDLVPGHTPEEHCRFQESKKSEPNEYANRYIRTDSWIYGGRENVRFVAGEAERNGVYIINFFKCQPALNYGFLEVREPWQLPPDHPDCVATREALKDIMRFWLEKGCDGFRVDMADSLVKNDDENKNGTQAVWRDVRSMLDAEFPDAALVSEWSAPGRSLRAGFHMDFLLDHEGSGYKSLLRDYRMGADNRPCGEDNSFFKKDGRGDIRRFLDQYLSWGQTPAPRAAPYTAEGRPLHRGQPPTPPRADPPTPRADPYAESRPLRREQTYDTSRHVSATCACRGRETAIQ